MIGVWPHASQRKGFSGEAEGDETGSISPPFGSAGEGGTAKSGEFGSGEARTGMKPPVLKEALLPSGLIGSYWYDGLDFLGGGGVGLRPPISLKLNFSTDFLSRGIAWMLADGKSFGEPWALIEVFPK
jgi:hypothetical protein